MTKRKQRRFFTKEELLKIYHASNSVTIANDLGSRSETVRNAKRYLKSYLDGRAFGNATPLAYKQAVAEIKGTIQVETPRANGVQQSGGGTDKLAKLQEMFGGLQEAIADVIADEVTKRTAQTLHEKDIEVMELKEKYETELQRLQAIIIQAKDSSLLGVIKRKMTTLQ